MPFKTKQERQKYWKQYYQSNKPKIDRQKANWNKRNWKSSSQTPNSRFSQYRSDARKRGFDFDLTIEQFTLYWQKDCYYCGISIPTIGLDRVDSTKGYLLDNIVACCKRCNRMKLDIPQSEFIEQIHRIANRF